MDLPPPLSSRCYNEHIKKAQHAVQIAEKIMVELADTLLKIVEKEKTSKFEVLKDGKQAVKAAVTVDGDVAEVRPFIQSWCSICYF